MKKGRGESIGQTSDVVTYYEGRRDEIDKIIRRKNCNYYEYKIDGGIRLEVEKHS